MAAVDVEGGGQKKQTVFSNPPASFTDPNPPATPAASSGGYTGNGTVNSTLSWTGNLTGAYGATDETRDSGYTDPYTGVWHPHFNKGLDFGVPIGTPIESPVSGRVTFISYDPWASNGWGISVEVTDAAGNVHSFNHLDSVNVSVGQQVTAGQVVARSGNTGRGYDPANPGAQNASSSGPHLSYDVRNPAGTYINPTSYLEGFSPGAINAREATAGDTIYGVKDAPVAEIARSDAVRNAMDLFEEPDPKDPDTKAEMKKLMEQQPGLTEMGAFMQLHSVWDAMKAELESSYQGFLLEENDIFQMPDGTLVPLKTLPPDLQEKFRNANNENWKTIQNKFAVDQYNLISDANQAKFAADVQIAQLKVGYENADLARASARVQRQLQGMAESRSRTQMLVDAILAIAPKATVGGKTEFTPGDFGAIGRELGDFAGIGENEVALRYQGTTHIDPDDILASIDAMMGVGGPVETIGESTLSLADLLPSYQATPVPTLLAPSGANWNYPTSPVTQGITTAPERSTSTTITPAQRAAINRVLGGEGGGIFGPAPEFSSRSSGGGGGFRWGPQVGWPGGGTRWGQMPSGKPIWGGIEDILGSIGIPGGGWRPWD